MQILSPGNHPFILGLKIIVISLSFIVAIAVLFFCIKKFRINKDQKFLSYLLLLISICIIYWSVSNIVIYTRSLNALEDKYIGYFFDQMHDEFIDLQKDNHWKSNSQLFSCDGGMWEHIASEDLFYLNLTCAETGHTMIQLFNCKQDTLFYEKRIVGSTETEKRTFIRQ